MRFRTCVCGLACAALLGVAAPAMAQATDGVGTRAQGMGGAFVGVADDASAVYWNPAGLAGGAYFSLVLDGAVGSAIRDTPEGASDRSSWLLALSTPALGLSFYRLEHTAARPTVDPAARYRLDTLTTRHLGATLVHSLTSGIAVGGTVKAVRGVAGSALVAATSAEDAVDNWDVAARAETKFDADLGVMASGTFGRLGMVVRNVTEPKFETGSGVEVPLERQFRVGGSILLLQTWKLAIDGDLNATDGPLGPMRELAFGTEGQITRRLAARTGLRFNTTGDDRGPAFSAGGSFAVMGSFQVDAQVTAGSDAAFSGWGLAGRFVF